MTILEQADLAIEGATMLKSAIVAFGEEKFAEGVASVSVTDKVYTVEEAQALVDAALVALKAELKKAYDAAQTAEGEAENLFGSLLA